MGGTGRAVLDAVPGLSAHSVHKLAALPRARVWGGAALLVLVWASTALLSVPAHEALLRLRGADKDGDHDGDKRQKDGGTHTLNLKVVSLVVVVK